MKRILLTLCCLLAFRLQATPTYSPEPIGQRLGMSLIEVIDSINKEGLYHYVSFKTDKRALGPVTGVGFEDKVGKKVLTYVFDRDKCVRAGLLLPIEDFEVTVVSYDIRYTKIGERAWRSPYGQIELEILDGEASHRYDHKPQVSVEFFVPKE